MVMMLLSLIVIMSTIEIKIQLLTGSFLSLDFSSLIDCNWLIYYKLPHTTCVEIYDVWRIIAFFVSH